MQFGAAVTGACPSSVITGFAETGSGQTVLIFNCDSTKGLCAVAHCKLVAGAPVAHVLTPGHDAACVSCRTDSTTPST